MTEQNDAFLNVLENVEAGSIELYKRLSPAGRNLFLTQADTMVSGDSEALKALYAVDYERIPPTVEQFLHHEDYIGGTDFTLYPGWEPIIKAACQPGSKITECIFTGAQGRGKTVAGVIMMLYKIVRLACMRDPAQFYGLSRGTQIVFGLYMVTKRQLRQTGFYEMRQLVDKMPFFKDVFPRWPHGKEQIRWDRGDKQFLVETASNRLHALGLSLFSCLADELNYYDQGQKSAEDARELVEELSSRLESRFLTDFGDIPGLAIFVSQTRTASDFLEQRAQNKRKDAHVLIDRGPRWERVPKPYHMLTKHTATAQHRADTASGKVPAFRVFVGSEAADARILDNVYQHDGAWRVEAIDPTESAPEESLIQYVPVNHFKRYTDDLNGALRLQGDVPSATYQPFFPRREVIESAFHEELIFPFRAQAIRCFERQGAFRLQEAFDYLRVTEIFMGKRAPMRHPEAPRYIHLDPATGKDGRDRYGLAMVHPAGHYMTENMPTPDNPFDEAEVGEGFIVKDVEVDFYIALIGGPHNEAVDFKKVRVFIDWLRRIGFWIRKVTADGWQTLDTLQLLRGKGFETDSLSVDRTSKPYKVGRQVMNEDRLEIPYPHGYTPTRWGSGEEALKRVILFQEMAGLEHDVSRDKVDHREKNPDGSRGSKDIADAVIGATYSCLMDTINPGDGPKKTHGRAQAAEKVNRYLKDEQVSKYLPRD